MALPLWGKGKEGGLETTRILLLHKREPFSRKGFFDPGWNFSNLREVIEIGPKGFSLIVCRQLIFTIFKISLAIL